MAQIMLKERTLPNSSFYTTVKIKYLKMVRREARNMS